MNTRKRDCERAVRTTISMPPALWRMALAIQANKHLGTFSDCIQELIRQAHTTQQSQSGLRAHT